MSSKVLLCIIPYNQLWGLSGLKGLFYALKEELLDPLSLSILWRFPCEEPAG